MKVYSSIIEHILNNYKQIALFSKYFRLPVSSIEYCLEHKTNKVNNPLRKDYTPSLGFLIKDDGKLISKDWADDSYSGDIFDLVGLLLNKSVRIPKEFMDICNNIINNNEINNSKVDEIIRNVNNKHRKIIKFKDRPFSTSDIKYWTEGGANIQHLKNRNVYPAQYIWIDNMLTPYYIHSQFNPAYIYYLGTDKGNDIIKTYNPNGDRGFKFRTNNKSVFEATHELYYADTLIITKSRKDKIVIESLLHYEDVYVSDLESDVIFLIVLAANKTLVTNNLELPKYCITSFNSESYKISIDLNNYLKKIYNNIIIQVDYDKTGILNAFYHHILFGYKVVFLGNNTDIYSTFTNKEIKRYFDKLLLINPNLTLFNSMLKIFIEEHRDNYKDKDIFEYCTSNGVNKGEDLVNNLFKKHEKI